MISNTEFSKGPRLLQWGDHTKPAGSMPLGLQSERTEQRRVGRHVPSGDLVHSTVMVNSCIYLTSNELTAR